MIYYREQENRKRKIARTEGRNCRGICNNEIILVRCVYYSLIIGCFCENYSHNGSYRTIKLFICNDTNRQWLMNDIGLQVIAIDDCQQLTRSLQLYCSKFPSYGLLLSQLPSASLFLPFLFGRHLIALASYPRGPPPNRTSVLVPRQF